MIYLDHNATTPVDEEVLQAMLPFFRSHFGNPSSRTHLHGWDAREAVEQARKQLARLLKADPKAITFTSGATEAVNLALRGLVDASPKEKKHIVTVKTEHKAVLDTCAWLEKHRGVTVNYLDVNDKGYVDLYHLAKAITKNTLVVAIMYVNNETGLIHPVEKIAKICKERNVLFFCDATQAVGKIPVHPSKQGIDLMACSAHKMYGPKGVGALYTAADIPLAPQITGGGQERKKRAGTLNVPAITGFGKAAEIAEMYQKQDSEQLEKKRNWLEEKICSVLPGTRINGCTQNRMPHVSNLCFENIEAEDLMLSLSTKVALSSGSACNSAEVLPSHVLKAMGLSDEEALASIRISLGRKTTQAEVEEAAELIVESVQRLRNA